jgi:hypothetical protein
MKKYLFLFTVLICVSINGNAQNFQKTYDITGGADGRGIATQQTSDGGFIIGGETGPGVSDFYIIKTNSSGVVTWNKTFGGGDDDDIFDIHQTTDAGYFMSGSTKSFGAGLNDIYAIKIDGSGNIVWSSTYGGASNEAGTSSIQTSDGGYIITGWTTSFGSGGLDLYVVKLSSTGALQWSRTVGGASDEMGMSVYQTSDGGYVIAGSTTSFGTSSSKDVYVVKLNSSGSLQWTKTYGGSGSDGGGSIKQTTDGGFIIGATTNGLELALIKTDGNGVLQWNKIYTETGCGGNSIACVVQTSDGGYAFSGNIVNCVAGAQNISLIKTDASGTIQWSKAYGGASGEFTHASMQQTGDGGFIITGDTKTLAASGSWDVYLIKTDASGNSGCHQSNVVFNESSPTLIVNSGGGQNNGGTKTTSSTIVTTPLTTLTPICIFFPGEGQGVKEIQSITNIKLYPNPSVNQNVTININANSPFDSNIELNDMYGRKVYEKNEKINSGNNSIALNTSELPSGLIVARITNTLNSEQLSIKFINQK